MALTFVAASGWAGCCGTTIVRPEHGMSFRTLRGPQSWSSSIDLTEFSDRRVPGYRKEIPLNAWNSRRARTGALPGRRQYSDQVAHGVTRCGPPATDSARRRRPHHYHHE